MNHMKHIEVDLGILGDQEVSVIYDKDFDLTTKKQFIDITSIMWDGTNILSLVKDKELDKINEGILEGIYG